MGGRGGWTGRTWDLTHIYTWQCPINVVFKVLLKNNIGTLVTEFKVFEGVQMETRIKLYQNVLN